MIIVKKNILSFDNMSFECAVGKNGITNNKVEGDGCTPSGIYLINQIYYRQDKVVLPNINIPSIGISKNFGWCDDVDSDSYNKIITFPFKQSAELLYRNDNIYDILCVIDYNQNPIIKNKGSAIFLHIASPDYAVTEGCIALKSADLLELLSKMTTKTNIKIIN
tara:strand:- start:27 stop:518 length:492 start_codon:yes stop_codon:yes gene_type:complete